jgi:hypothetical protein
MLDLKELEVENLSIIQASQIFMGMDRPTLKMLHLTELSVKSLQLVRLV